jgi:hypothetical protein
MGKLILESGLPAWAQVPLMIVILLIYHFFGKKKRDKANDDLLKGKDNFRKRLFDSNILTQNYYAQTSDIRSQIESSQRNQSALILQKFMNDISVQYEKGLDGLNFDEEKSELLILAFNGFLYRLKEDLMEQIIDFITSQGFKSDDYKITKESLQRLSQNISLCISNTFRGSYKASRFKVNFSDNLPEVNIENMLEGLYSQVKEVGNEGEAKIKTITLKYEEDIKTIIGEL